MPKTAASKVARVGRTASMVFVLAAVLAGCSGETADSGGQAEDEAKAAPAARPHANDDHATTVEGRSVLVRIVANDSGSSLQIDRIKPRQSHGDIICEAPMQSCEYTPGKGFTGKDEFSYVVRDAKGRSDSAMVYVRVKPSN